MKRKNAKQSKKEFPDYSDELNRLGKIIGQLNGIEKMISTRRYCPDIIQQTRAARSALGALELAIIRGHLASCIKDSAKSDSPKAFDEKLKGLLDLIKGP